MKKFVAVLLALSMVFALCACGGDGASKDVSKDVSKDDIEDDPKDEIEEKLKRAVQRDAKMEFNSILHPDIKNVETSVTKISHDGNEYRVEGEVTVTDRWGDKYVGEFTAYYTLNGEKLSDGSLYVGTLYKAKD